MGEFSLTTRVVFEENVIERLDEITGICAIVVHDPIMEKMGFCAKAEQALRRGKFTGIIFEKVNPEPDAELVARCLCAYEEAKADTIIAMGGGAAIDTAKAIIYFCRMLGNGAKKRPLFVAIPTTAGTGSEVTNFSVITANEKKNVLIDGSIAPDVAYLDTQYLVSLPNTVIADTGIDALVHAIESYVSSGATDYTDALSKRAVELIFHWLKPMYDNPSDPTAREHMLNASCMAGMAFTNSNLGINHSLAHAMGARFHIAHGRANALLLPAVIAYNAGLSGSSNTPAAEKYRQLAAALSLPARTTREGVSQLISALQRLMLALHMPETVEKLGSVSNEDFEAAVFDMAETAMNDRCTSGNPVVPNKEDLIWLYRQAYSGRLI